MTNAATATSAETAPKLEHPGAPGTLAALDVGTNSFHLVVARFSGEGHQFEVLTREKEMVRLGSGSGDMKVLEDDAIDRGIAALTRCRQIAEAHGARLHAVATSAVREAENADVFLARASEEAGVDVEVISGTEEARLIHLGVLQAVPVFERRLLLIDIGGGSTEVLVGERGEILTSGSLKLGAIRLTRRFFRSDSLHPAAVDSCRRHVRAALAPIRREVRKHGFEVAVGSSGTIGAVAAMIFAARDPDATAPRVWNNFEFTRKEVRAVVRALVEAGTVEERLTLPGLDEKRADIILGGAIILEEAMGELEIATMVVSDYALREGVLLDARERERGGALTELHDLRRRNVLHLSELMDDDPAHAVQTARLALEIFDQTAKWHGLDDDARELLESAALLANVGQFVSHDKHHKHSYYVIRNSDHLSGFTDHEIELIALIARYHRKSAPKAGHPEFAALRAADRELVATCAGILRIAIGLDRTHSALVDHVTVTKAPKNGKSGKVDDGERPLRIEVAGRPDADLSLELYTANERKDLLESVFAVPIEILTPEA
jgi:exopolyphosphatase/guanosine-5'-triphosphate,3'-diphosphate pyrophosphatase